MSLTVGTEPAHQLDWADGEVGMESAGLSPDNWQPSVVFNNLFACGQHVWRRRAGRWWSSSPGELRELGPGPCREQGARGSRHVFVESSGEKGREGRERPPPRGELNMGHGNTAQVRRGQRKGHGTGGKRTRFHRLACPSSLPPLLSPSRQPSSRGLQGAGPNLDPSGRAWGGGGRWSGGFEVSSSGGREPMAGRQVLDGGDSVGIALQHGCMRRTPYLHRDPPGIPGTPPPQRDPAARRTAAAEHPHAAGLSWRGGGARPEPRDAGRGGSWRAGSAGGVLLEPACRDGRAKVCRRARGRVIPAQEERRREEGGTKEEVGRVYIVYVDRPTWRSRTQNERIPNCQAICEARQVLDDATLRTSTGRRAQRRARSRGRSPLGWPRLDRLDCILIVVVSRRYLGRARRIQATERTQADGSHGSHGSPASAAAWNLLRDPECRP